MTDARPTIAARSSGTVAVPMVLARKVHKAYGRLEARCCV